MRRRAVLAGAASLPFNTALAALPVPAGDRLAFNIIRKGSTIGEHRLAFTRRDNKLTVAVAVDIAIGLGPIAFFRYRHRATVHWENQQVVSVDAETNDDGTPQQMHAWRDEGGLMVEGSKAARYVAPPHALPGTHWNKAMLNAPFINTQDGRLMHPTVTKLGMERIAITGGSLMAQHYQLRGDANLDTYYDATPTWVGLRFAAKDGSEILYQKN